MARPLSSDPLVAVQFRLPRSVVVRLKAQADAVDLTISDVLRARFGDSEVTPTFNPRPRRREKSLVSATPADPELMRHVARVGSNLNQFVRVLNSKSVAGKPIELTKCLAYLVSLDEAVKQISVSASKK